MYATIWYLFPISADQHGDMIYETHQWFCPTRSEFDYAMEVLSPDDILKIEY